MCDVVSREAFLFCKTLRCYAENVFHENYNFNANKYIVFKELIVYIFLDEHFYVINYQLRMQPSR